MLLIKRRQVASFEALGQLGSARESRPWVRRRQDKVDALAVDIAFLRNLKDSRGFIFNSHRNFIVKISCCLIYHIENTYPHMFS